MDREHVNMAGDERAVLQSVSVRRQARWGQAGLCLAVRRWSC